MSDRETASAYIDEVNRATAALDLDEIESIVEVLSRARRDRRRVFIVGNGGSSSTASHFACDLSKGALREDQPAIRAASLTDNVPMMTAWANDVSYGEAFAEQLSGFAERHDVLIGISTSGDSENVLKAIRRASELGLVTVGMTGKRGANLAVAVDHCLIVESEATAVVEDVHMILSHLLAHVLLKGQHEDMIDRLRVQRNGLQGG
jgi:D-sedoheptulose 7-phosphate isomerase